MGNMSYCRFENTYEDLRDCYEALEECGGVDDYIKEHEPNSIEEAYIHKLIQLAKDLVERFEE